jgi:small subunit ribosomal protein S21
LAITVEVRNGNIIKAMRILKKKVLKEGLLNELRERQYYMKPSEKKREAKKRNMKRVFKERQKREMELGIVPTPKKR